MYTELKEWLLHQREKLFTHGCDCCGSQINHALNHVTALDEQYQKDLKGFDVAGNALALALDLKDPEHIKTIQDVVKHLVLAHNESRTLLEIMDEQKVSIKLDQLNFINRLKEKLS